MKQLRHIISILVIILIAVLAAGTIIERLHSSDFALTHVYGTWWFAGLWALLASLMVYMTVLCAAFRCLNKSAYRTAKNFPRRHHFVGVGACRFNRCALYQDAHSSTHHLTHLSLPCMGSYGKP